VDPTGRNSEESYFPRPGEICDMLPYLVENNGVSVDDLSTYSQIVSLEIAGTYCFPCEWQIVCWIDGQNSLHQAYRTHEAHVPGQPEK
jgi:hypothetical protein